ncbi:MAG: phenol 2-monooxygenase [Bdellovibrionaceae bacterium]|nr:phenol 2-monooxygenase [Pseudobdellovibrionaceae bacterium]MBX3033316.1 phenol 2-monooxygenase [Pseudobdellovibrionaceae bacterium]
MSARTIYQMKVVELIDHTHNIRELVMQTQEPAQFRFKAGQFVMLHVPQATGKPALRAYSIASDERQDNGFRLIFKYVENGLASKYVWDLQGGETLQFTGPFGKVFFQEPPTEQIVFLNTGSGVSQHLCYLLSKKEQYPNLRYRMLFGVRHEKDIYHRELLDRLAAELPDFKYEFILSRPEAGWTGRQGYIQNFMREFGYVERPTTFYLCGNGAMIKDAKKIFEEDGVEKSRIWAEAFD